MSEFEEQMKSTKNTLIDKDYVKVKKETFDSMNKVINETKKVMEIQPRLNQLFQEVNDYANSYSSLEKVNQKYSNEIKALKTRNCNLIVENNKLKDYIDIILEVIKKFFRKLLQIGNDKTKDATVLEVKDYFDSQDFNKDDVCDIAKDTTKEDELFDYVGVSKEFDKSLQIKDKKGCEIIL